MVGVMSDKFSRVTIDVDIQTNTIHSQVIYMPVLKDLSIHYDTAGPREGVNIIMKNFREVTPSSLVDTWRFRSNLFLQSPNLNLLPPTSLTKERGVRYFPKVQYTFTKLHGVTSHTSTPIATYLSSPVLKFFFP